MVNKDKYEMFCKQTYVPIYSKPWWLDAVCGENNWDVWLYEKGNQILAAMPYYMEQRESYSYITKALLTQNNGIIFCYPENLKRISKQAFEEKIIDAACKYIESLHIDVYEQQYQYSFTNWLPFFWNRYTAAVRYTYVLDHLFDIDEVWGRLSSCYRNKIKKGKKNTCEIKEIDYIDFYNEHEKIFLKQGLQCPFSFSKWEQIYKACHAHYSGQIIAAKTYNDEIASVLFLVWDEQSVYQLLGGSMPEHQSKDTYDALIWEGIQFALRKGLKYDFEGSMIKRISKSFREFGGEPKPYFRIRKVFNPDIMRMETEKNIMENINVSRGDRPKTHNPNLKVEDKANGMKLYESKVDATNDYNVNLKQKVGTTDRDKIVLGRSEGGV